MEIDNLLTPPSEEELTDRSIQLLIDSDTGEILEADDLLENEDEKVLHTMRATLKAAQKSGDYKYLCAVCEQCVHLVSRRITSYDKTVLYFSHLPHSLDCPVKTSVKNPIELLRNRQNEFRESNIHMDMIRQISQSLSTDGSFGDIRTYPDTYIRDTNGSAEYRRPDIATTYTLTDGRSVQLILELHIFTTLLSVIVDREAFFKENGMHLMWIFPDFSSFHQRMGQKDIYYLNRRNVFVFDRRDGWFRKEENEERDYAPPFKRYEYAYEASQARNTLMLNCWWLTPKLDDEGKIRPEWHNKLVSIHELTFDPETHEVYYYDSDKDFYQNSDPELQKKITEWEEALRRRTAHIHDSLNEKARRFATQQERLDRAEQIRHFRELIKQAERGDITPEAFRDPDTNLYGFRLGEFLLVKPRFKEVGSWSNGHIPVRMANWGVINYAGGKVLPFNYTEFGPFTDGVAIAVRKDNVYEIIDTNGNEITNTVQYSYIRDFKDGIAIARKDGKDGCLDKDGNTAIPFEFDDIKDFKDGFAKAKKDGKDGYIDMAGNALPQNKTELSNGLIRAEKFGIYSCLDKDGNTVIPFEFGYIEDFKDGIAKAKKGWKYGYIDKNGNTVIPFEFDGIRELKNGTVLAKKSDGSAFLIDETRELRPLKRGDVLYGTVSNIETYGLFIDVAPLDTGLLHISKLESCGLSLSSYRKWDEITVKLLSIKREKHRVEYVPENYVIKEKEEKLKEATPTLFTVGSSYHGKVEGIKPYGLFVNVEGTGTALLHKSELAKANLQPSDFSIGQEIDVKVESIVDMKARLCIP